MKEADASNPESPAGQEEAISTELKKAERAALTATDPSHSAKIQEKLGESSLRRELKTEKLRSEESLPSQGMGKDWNSPASAPRETDAAPAPRPLVLEGKIEPALRPASGIPQAVAQEEAKANTKPHLQAEGSAGISEAIRSPAPEEQRTAEIQVEKPAAQAASEPEKNQRTLQAERETLAAEKALGIQSDAKSPESASIVSGSKDWDPIRYKERSEKTHDQGHSRVAPTQEDKFITRIPGTSSSEEDSGFLLTRYQIIMTFQELNDNQSSWHPVDQYRIYLSAKHRYYGVKDVAEIFPLWIYEGELAPEFLETKKSWRFYDRAPQPYYSLEALPMPVFEFFSHFTAVKDWVSEKKKGLDKASQEHARFFPKEEEEKKPQRRKRGFWSFVKNLFWKS